MLTFRVVSVVCALSAAPVLGGELIKPTADVSDLRVVVKRISTGELVNLQRQYGARVDRRDLRQSQRHGFTLVRRSLETGAFTCEIYLPADKRPRTVDDEATLIYRPRVPALLAGQLSRVSAVRLD